jgi:hypothetical protein
MKSLLVPTLHIAAYISWLPALYGIPAPKPAPPGQPPLACCLGWPGRHNSVANAFLDSVGRGHAVAGTVDQLALEQIRPWIQLGLYGPEPDSARSV